MDFKENITQIMWPSLYLGQTAINSLDNSPLHQKAERLAKSLLGEDMAFDFDMLISKVRLNEPTIFFIFKSSICV